VLCGGVAVWRCVRLNGVCVCTQTCCGVCLLRATQRKLVRASQHTLRTLFCPHPHARLVCTAPQMYRCASMLSGATTTTCSCPAGTRAANRCVALNHASLANVGLCCVSHTRAHTHVHWRPSSQARRVL
jgi:hypothetical protein